MEHRVQVKALIRRTQAQALDAMGRMAWLENHLRVKGYKAAPFHLRQAKLALDQASLSLEQAMEQVQADQVADAQLQAGAKALTGVVL